MIRLQPRHCALCGPETAKKELFAPSFGPDDLNAEVFSARRTPDRRHFRLVECATCGMVFSDPACDPSELSSLYERGEVRYGPLENQIYRSYAPVLDEAAKISTGRGTFLEIGGGSGFMLRYGAERGFASQIEIEPSADAERKFSPPSASARFIRASFKKGLIPPGSASLACFFQMLDHVPDPRAFLEDVFDVLEPGGAAVCVTHDTSAFSARLLGERSPIYDLEHTYLFNPRNISRLFERAGFAQPRAFGVANRYETRYWLSLAPLPGAIKKHLLAGLEATGLAGLPLSLKAGNLAIIARKPQ